MLRLLTHTTKIVVLTAGLAFGGAVEMAHAQDGGAGSTASEGPSSLTETYQSWVVRCARGQTAEGQLSPQVCEMYQDLRQAEGNQRILTMALQSQTAGGAGLTLVSPFGLLLSEGIQVTVSDAPLINLGFRTCLPTGCIASDTIGQAAIDQLAAANEAQVRMVSTAGQPLTLTVSLAGFNTAWNRLLDLGEE